MTTLKELLALGFTPAAAISIVACIVLWLRMESGTRKQNRVREEWHTATLARVDELTGHVESCNEDREQLKDNATLLETEVATLRERVTRMSSCPSKRCPLRLPP